MILACVGGTVQAALHALAGMTKGGRRPVVVTGYVGVVYERVIDGLLLRAGADVVIANSAHDQRLFTQILDEAGVAIPEADTDEQENEVETFREFLDSISPEDFGRST